MKGKKHYRGIRGEHSLEFRTLVVQDYLTGNLSYGQIVKKYGLRDREQIKWWVRYYRQNTDLPIVSLPPMTEAEKQEKQALEKRIRELEARLKEAQLKGLALDTMIDVAEEMFDIDIRKKPGTKQSDA